MLIVALYFLLLFFISYGIGTIASRPFNFLFTITDTVFLGLTGITILASIWAFFLPLDDYFSFGLVVLSGLGMVFQKGFIRLRESLIALELKDIVFLIIIILMVALASSLPAYALDNESYYIQTIKWLDHYGFVTGLGNLHHFLIQQSGVHVLQSALNFDGLYDRFNNISAFYLLIGLCWSAFAKAESTSNLIATYKKLFPIALFLFLLFSTAPTPDIPVYVLSYYIIYKFLVLWESEDRSQLSFLILLCFTVAYFKAVAALIVILPIALLIRHKVNNKRVLYKALGWCFLFLGLFVIKNSIISGLPLFPLTTWSPVEFSWQMNPEIATHFKQLTAAQPFHTWPSELVQLGSWELIKLWLFHPGFDTVLNWLTLFTFLASIVFMIKSKRRKLQIICGIFLLQSILLAITSPQFRFFFNLLYPVLILTSIVSIPLILRFKKQLVIVAYISGALLFVTPQLISLLTDNPLMKDNVNLELSMIIEPSPVSKYPKKAFQEQEGNLIYYHSKSDDRIWNTNDVPLPAVQKRYIEYYKKYFHSRPQMRTDQLKDGFYSENFPSD